MTLFFASLDVFIGRKDIEYRIQLQDNDIDIAVKHMLYWKMHAYITYIQYLFSFILYLFQLVCCNAIIQKIGPFTIGDVHSPDGQTEAEDGNATALLLWQVPEVGQANSQF